jgi:hypothetical protein
MAMELSRIFTTPMHPPVLWGAGILAVALLVLFRKATVVCPDLALPWEGFFIEAPPQQDSRRIPPLWVWILAAAVMALGYAASQPIGPPDRSLPRLNVVLLEADVTSQSRELGGRRRLDRLRDALRQWSSGRPADDRFLLIRVGSRPTILGAELTPSQFAEALDQVQPGDAPADWDAALRLALTNLRGDHRVLALAAGQPYEHWDKWSARTGTAPPPLVYFREGASRPNTAIETVSVLDSPFKTDPRDFEVFICFRHFGAAPKRNATLLVNGKHLGDQEVPGGRDQVVVWSLPGKIREPGVLTIRLTPADDQPADDVARVVLPQRQPLRIGVSPSIARAMPTLQNLARAFPIELVDLAASSPGASEPLGLIIVPPPSGPDGHLPDCNAMVVGGAGAPVTVVPLGLDFDHPLCRDVTRLDVAEMPAWPAEDDSSGDVALHGATKGSPTSSSGRFLTLAWTTLERRYRRAHFAFDPFAYGPKFEVRAAALLLINAVEWLAPETVLPLSLTAGMPVPLGGIGPGPVSVQREAAEGRAAEDVASASETAMEIPGAALELAGIHQLLRAGRPAGRFAVNPASSPIVGEHGPAIEDLTTQSALTTPGRKPSPADFLWWGLGLALLALETLWFLWKTGRLQAMRRRRKAARSAARETEKAHRARSGI